MKIKVVIIKMMINFEKKIKEFDFKPFFHRIKNL